MSEFSGSSLSTSYTNLSGNVQLNGNLLLDSTYAPPNVINNNGNPNFVMFTTAGDLDPSGNPITIYVQNNAETTMKYVVGQFSMNISGTSSDGEAQFATSSGAFGYSDNHGHCQNYINSSDDFAVLYGPYNEDYERLNALGISVYDYSKYQYFNCTIMLIGVDSSFVNCD